MAKKKQETSDGLIETSLADQEVLRTFLERKEQLKTARRNAGVEAIWRQADADYMPHELGAPNKKVLVENERTEVSSFINLKKDEWRSKIASNDPYVKIQTALSILFDRNPEAVFEASNKRSKATTKLREALYHRTWTDTKIGSKKELRKFIFNLSKYGWSPARRFYKHIVRKNMNAIERYNLETQKFEYKKKDMVDFDDVYFGAMNPFDVWIDDMARPDDPRTRRDWMWREVFDKITARNMFGPAADLLSFSTISLPERGVDSAPYVRQINYTSTDLTEVYFYENRLTDTFLIESNNKLISHAPLSREDKELSLVDTYWTLRSTDSPYGIGINEIMRGSKVMLDRVRNMTIDQVVLSIYKMFFFSNSEQLDDEGGETINLEPGKGKKVIDPKNINWVNVPGPGQDAYTMMDMLKKDTEVDTGINRTLGGEITGKTAFEVGQAKEGALKRLAVPLRNIKAALEWDAYLCVGLQTMVYSVPKVFATTDPDIIKNYIASINDDKERYFTSANGTFNILKYREFELNVANNDGTFEASKFKQFFEPTPTNLAWEGQITIRVESMIEQSRALERQDTLQVSNILVPIIGQMAANPALKEAFMPTAESLLKEFDKDPKEWLPQSWLEPQMAPSGLTPTPPEAPMEAPGNPQAATMQGKGGNTPPMAPTVVPSAQLPSAGNDAAKIQQFSH